MQQSMNRSSWPGLMLGTALGLSAPPTVASELLSLLEVLRDNGTITQAQYQRLRLEAEGRRAARASSGQDAPTPAMGTEPGPTADAQPKSRPEARADATTPAPAETAKGSRITTRGGLSVTRADGAFGFRLGGNLWIDGAHYQEDRFPFGSGIDVRRARLKLGGWVFDDWAYQAEYDFAGNGADVKDAYLEYRGFDDVSIKLGQFKEPFSLEEQTSGANLTFMERALPVEAFAPGRRLGIGLMGGGKRWSGAGGLFGEAVGDAPEDEIDSGWGAAARGTYAVVDQDDLLVHLGGSVAYRALSEGENVRFRVTPETAVAEQRLVDTGALDDVNETLAFGLEGALVSGPLTLQGEYIQTGLARGHDQDDLTFAGWYLSGSWMLTGEARRYDGQDGRFKRITPNTPWGAWELAVRYSQLDLRDATVDGGAQEDLTLGLNAYLNDNLRFMINHIWVNADPDKRGGTDRPRIIQMRAQLDF